MKPYYETKLGKLYCGDALEIMPELEPVDLVIADPPYDIHAGKGGGCFGSRKHLIDTGGFTDGGCDYSFLENKNDWFVFCSLKQLSELLLLPIKNKSLITWCKSNPVPTCNNKYLPDVEYIVHSFSKSRLFGKYKDKSCFVNIPCGIKQTEHPNEKPK
jgi:DNA modification methylase